MSITHHTETGLMLLTPVTRRLGPDNWPERFLSPRNGAGRSPRCTELLIVSLFNKHDHCFPCRPNSSSVVDGQRWGNAVNFSLARGFNCFASSQINTFVRNVETGEEFHLARMTPCASINTGLSSAEAAASIKSDDGAEAALVIGTAEYLWRHNGCPGRYNQGCFRMSTNQGEITTDVDSMSLQCHLGDASIHSRKVQKYARYWKLKNWTSTRVTSKDNAHLIAIAGKRWQSRIMNTDKSCWVNGVLPE